MEKCSFDRNIITISQYGGIVHGFEEKNYAALTHYDYRATDFSISEDVLYAPCKLRCVFHNYILSFGCVASVFETLDYVPCADGTARKLTFMMFHGGTTNGGSYEDGDTLSSMPTINTTYNKNESIYKEGLDGLGTGPHIHLDILEGHITQSDQNTISENELMQYINSFKQIYYNNKYVKGFYTDKSLNFHEVFFDTNGIAFNTAAGEGESSAYAVWGEDIQFTESSVEEETLFIPIGKVDGWYTENGNTYYVEDEEILTGWQVLTAPNSLMLYDYYFNVNGVMIKNSFLEKNGLKVFVNENGQMVKNAWFTYPVLASSYYYAKSTGELARNEFVAAGSDWYFLGDDYKMVTDDWVNYPVSSGEWYYVDNAGKMLTGWQQVTDGSGDDTLYWYYFNPGTVSGYETGQMVRSTWIAGSNCWYYVLASGQMAVQCQIYDAGYQKYFAFAHDGACVNASGQDTMYDVETYPYKSE